MFIREVRVTLQQVTIELRGQNKKKVKKNIKKWKKIKKMKKNNKKIRKK